MLLDVTISSDQLEYWAECIIQLLNGSVYTDLVQVALMALILGVLLCMVITNRWIG